MLAQVRAKNVGNLFKRHILTTVQIKPFYTTYNKTEANLVVKMYSQLYMYTKTRTVADDDINNSTGCKTI